MNKKVLLAAIAFSLGTAASFQAAVVDVVEGSEEVTIVVRDKNTQLQLSSQRQRQNLDPETATIFVQRGMSPIAGLLLTGYRYEVVQEEVPHLAGDTKGDAWWLAEMRGMSASLMMGSFSVNTLTPAASLSHVRPPSGERRTHTPLGPDPWPQYDVEPSFVIASQE